MKYTVGIYEEGTSLKDFPSRKITEYRIGYLNNTPCLILESFDESIPLHLREKPKSEIVREFQFENLAKMVRTFEVAL